MALAVGHQFRGINQLNTENKLNQTQNFPNLQEKNFTKMKLCLKNSSERLLRREPLKDF